MKLSAARGFCPKSVRASRRLPKTSNSWYYFTMSYRTFEVEIDHGRISAKGSEALPEKASGLLTILNPPLSQPRPNGPDDFNTPLPEDILKAFKGK
jgi:hypothetical protein